MRKKIERGFFRFMCPILLFISLTGMAQTPGEWTWMHGNNTPGSLGIFGVQGVPNATNTPPALYEPCEWKDNNGKFWLFGGLNTMAGNRYSALWKYDPVTNQWTWIKGPSGVNQPGVYGVKGVPSPANYPGARSHGIASWTDLSGNLWLFGGNNPGGALLNDLWKYDIATNQWTWMHGSNVAGAAAVVGVMGIAAPANTPSGHDEAVGSGVDNLGNLWLYGGRTNDGDNVWKYDVATNQWTWMKGSNTWNSAIVYGTQGTSAPTNTPGGARWPHASWTDALGNLWFFGGNVTAFPGGYTNDLWKYTLAINEWTWVKGPNTQNNAGNYGAQCVSAPANNPPSRHETRARVKDECGNFWMFGGYSSTGSRNDLWYYNLLTNQWTWISGSNTTNQAAIYGTKGVSAPANRPDAGGGGVAWIDNNGYIYIFGGLTGASSTFSNALFRYVPNNPSLSLIQVNSTTCAPCNGSATVNVTCGQANFNYTWSNGISITNSISNTNTVSGLCPGTYTVTVTSDCNKSQTTIFNITGNNCTGPTVTATGSSVCPNSCATVTSSGANGTSPYTYSWSNGSTTQNINPCPVSTSTYTVTIRDSGGSTSTS
ncbi:MAG: hypothetical protein HYU69_09075, partial [Bacteroidetes bacterium]|nr:hypothetical protein [Bacteroidota bacterium]